MRRYALGLMIVLGGCSNDPEVVWLGEHESPCETGADCMVEGGNTGGPPRVCLRIDGHGSCTETCTDSSTCPVNYACVLPEGVCAPSGDGVCRDVHARCGPSFPPCCYPLGCVDFEGWGPRCVRVGCGPGGITSCPSDFCCVQAGSDTVCSPPTHCPG
jgi:hypothetical protein